MITLAFVVLIVLGVLAAICGILARGAGKLAEWYSDSMVGTVVLTVLMEIGILGLAVWWIMLLNS